ncbi:uncharacterized protein TRIADDRAFT_25372 [Trichoplax adhaerens]|uniref:Cytochrome P450 n=1 Tax=Trichoplax adhaerens TaxID=10228 RepID=B3RXJ7_TRIAD|nr:hypothetical protein TRIADDRAFT_25372 [Trichoplax adhaerens]EDV24440.1 hypothetical protein TRIADDRAFT_25372 [Trichoplax adhaerens]|eukprot:XP_002112330.1 hypothetical protein TRIADDRAFT_25372 [Trichoplax adhaerens]
MAWSSILFVQIILVCIVSSGFLLCYKLFIIPYVKMKKMNLKGPPFKPLIGNLLDYGITKQHIAQIKLREKYGDIYGTQFFQIPTIWIGDPDILKMVMVKEFSNFPNRYSFAKALNPLDKGLPELKDQSWHRIRNVVLPTFSSSKLKLIYPYICEMGNHLVESLISNADGNGRAIEFCQPCSKFTIEIILATAFGIEIDNLAEKEKLTRATNIVFGSQPSALFLLLFTSVRLFKMIEPIFGEGLASLEYITKVTTKIIKQRRRNMEAGIECRKDFLQQIIEAGDQDKLNDDEIVGQAFIFLTAGFHTISNTLSFACYLLATNPDKQQKLYQEIESIFSADQDIDYDTLFELSYLNMVVLETMRIYPAGFFINRDIKEDKTINGIHFAKGAMLAVPIYAIHHNPKLWPDPDKFIPERFTEEEKVKRHPFSYIPFGDGPRNCIGMRLALLEVKLAVAKIVQKMELLTTEKTEIPLEMETGTNLTAPNGIYLAVRKRH